MKEILVAGGGPAGAAAAIAGRLDGSPVRLLDRATTFRHKVCGEFISPDASELLEALRVWPDFQALRPRRIDRCILHLGSRVERWRLSECAWGLSRLQLDRMLLDKASLLGASVSRGESVDCRRTDQAEGPVICACGRTQLADKHDRVFGFKTHFEGPLYDAVELFFDASGYVGVSGIEDGLTNVCGIAPESLLRRYGFDFDEAVRRSPELAERLRPVQRRMGWIVTGPLSFAPPSPRASGTDVYPAGDSLTFVDPFTGSGILNALLTGRLAGMAAARQIPRSEYLKACRNLLGRAFLTSSVLRRLVGLAEVHWLVRYLSGEILFRLTRANFAGASATREPAWSRP
jgi:flavin-dependent dehydrogenase